MKGIVFDIQRFSVHDGDGIRSVVFLKGCPLHCPWCCNPESQEPKPQLMFKPSRCIECGLCGGPQGKAGQFLADDNRAAPEKCPTGAIGVSGREMTVAEVMAELAKDEVFYNTSGGGITLSGGEVLSQADFAGEILAQAKERGYHTAIETSGFGDEEALNRLARFSDQVLFDLKTTDPVKQREVLGGDYHIMISNLRSLAWHPQVIIRHVLVPGFNMELSDYQEVAGLMATHKRKEIHLLPLHHLGSSKYSQLGRDYPAQGYPAPEPGRVKEAAEFFRQQGLTVVVGG